MNKILKTLAATALIAVATPASAQTALRSGYFMEGYSYRHQLNPALAPNTDYVSIPVLSGFNLSMQSNFGINNFLYEKPGTNELMLFTNKAVSASDFLGELKDNNRMAMEMNITLFSLGLHRWGGFNTVELNLRSDLRANLPKGLFEFIKDMHTGGSYSFDNLGFSSTTYTELALGHSRRITDEWRVGGKLKILIGMADMDMRVENMTATMGADKWSINGNGYMNIATRGLTVGTDDRGKMDLGDADVDGFGTTGAGMAIDLGATYRPHQVEGLEVSLALNDLGFINWKNNVGGNMSSNWEFKGFNISQDDTDYDAATGTGTPGYNSFDTEMDNLGDDLKDCFGFERDEDASSRCRALGATLNIGASYILPQYDKLKFGFLSSTRINGPYSWSEGRFSATVAPVKCLDVTINYAASTFGHSFGWLLNVHTKGFGLFMGTDHMFGKHTPQGLPAGRANMSFAMGINFPFGKQKASRDL